MEGGSEGQGCSGLCRHLCPYPSKVVRGSVQLRGVPPHLGRAVPMLPVHGPAQWPAVEPASDPAQSGSKVCPAGHPASIAWRPERWGWSPGHTCSAARRWPPGRLPPALTLLVWTPGSPPEVAQDECNSKQVGKGVPPILWQCRCTLEFPEGRGCGLLSPQDSAQWGSPLSQDSPLSRRRDLTAAQSQC